jgi:hypothetical protein
VLLLLLPPCAWSNCACSTSIHSEIDLRKATRIFRVAFGGRFALALGYVLAEAAAAGGPAAAAAASHSMWNVTVYSCIGVFLVSPRSLWCDRQPDCPSREMRASACTPFGSLIASVSNRASERWNRGYAGSSSPGHGALRCTAIGIWQSVLAGDWHLELSQHPASTASRSSPSR